MAAKIETQVLRVDSSREIHVESSVPIVAKSVCVDALEITFDEPADWTGMGLVVWFANSYDKTISQVPWNGSDRVTIPATVTQNPGWLGVTVVGTITSGSGDEQIVSQRGVTKLKQNTLRIYESLEAIGTEVDPEEEAIAADVLDQVLSAMGRAEAAAGSAATSATQAATIAAEVGVDFTPATASAAGTHGLVPAPAAGTEGSTALTADGTWGVDLNDKADIDGYYELLTAGAADNLTGRGDGVSASFLYRTAGGTEDIADGVATIKAIYGETVGWNQLNNPTSSIPDDKRGLTLTLNASGGLDISGTANSSGTLAVTQALTLHRDGRKYLIKPSKGLNRRFTVKGYDPSSFGPSATAGNAFFFSRTEGTDWFNHVCVRVDEGEVVNISDLHISIFDLTAMFGAGNEPATVEEFEALYPLPYYPYDPGTLKPVNMTGVETVGFNQWDEEWEAGGISPTNGLPTTSTNSIRSKNYIPVFPSTEYSIGITDKTANWILVEYDADEQYIGYLIWGGALKSTWNFTTSSNARYVKFNTNTVNATGTYYGTTYNNDIAVHLKWSGYRDGEYESYWKSQREIAIAEHFPTGMKSAGTAADALYKDHADHVIGSVDLGTLNWEINTSGNNNLFRSTTRLSNAKPPADQAVVPNAKCSKYEVVKYSGNGSGQNDKRLMIIWGDSSYHHQIWIADSAYDDPAAFKAAMSGVMLYYELATPTTEVIDPPLNLGYRVSDFGTERVMLANGVISAPPIFEISYGLNAVDTIRRLPTQYISDDSFENFCDAAFGSGTVTKTWDDTDNCYHYEIASLDDDTIASLVDADWRD